MSTGVFAHEVIMEQLHDLYQLMLSQQLIKATQLKKEIDEKIEHIKHAEEEKQNQNVLLYHSLLDFKYKLLTDRLSIRKDSFDVIGSIDETTDKLTAYYYHSFKAEHALMFSDYNEASRQYEEAESLLEYISDELEHAEFNQKLAVLHHTSKMLTSIEYANKAKEIFAKHAGYEVKVASCENTLGTACIFLKQFEQAEEHLNRSIDILQKQNEEKLILVVRHNLGLLYAMQNLSLLAIRHLSEVTEKNPNHFKALFLQAREHYKLQEINIAQELIEKGLKVCDEIGNEEYVYHFNILRLLNENKPIELVEEEVKKSISYFKKQGLWEFVEEYGELLAVAFRKLHNHEKVSDYFNVCYEAKQQIFSKGALK
ncbi:tetratricopeptide repeat protein [Bacillus cytotoxicus]|uniref:tetratricopeptide repeat protein n=1 Tax=Bacillus cereus group sp. BfR-BA-01492 TaxID=2920361 RepID=UPI001F594CF6|nr:tetratricopeptide repeat protein [Bacillus cereus group sp. BfR-BA-01492]EMA6344704.1 tetratricopeptide repeat protein [Bacillus cytotoxicus]